MRDIHQMHQMRQMHQMHQMHQKHQMHKMHEMHQMHETHAVKIGGSVSQPRATTHQDSKSRRDNHGHKKKQRPRPSAIGRRSEGAELPARCNGNCVIAPVRSGSSSFRVPHWGGVAPD